MIPSGKKYNKKIQKKLYYILLFLLLKLFLWRNFCSMTPPLPGFIKPGSFPFLWNLTNYTILHIYKNFISIVFMKFYRLLGGVLITFQYSIHANTIDLYSLGRSCIISQNTKIKSRRNKLLVGSGNFPTFLKYIVYIHSWNE